MMPDPDDLIPVKHPPKPVEGYLVEAQTLSGLSGSPVYVRRSIKVAATEVTGVEPLAYGAVFLLGMWIAAWDINEVSVGMGVVVPADKILETLNHDDLREMRSANKAAKEEKRTDFSVGELSAAPFKP